MPIRSPFPGMDPYLEAHWRDVHHRFQIYACDAIQGLLPPKLIARVEERVFIQPEEGLGRSFYPDLRVIEHPRAKGGGTAPAAGTAVADAIIVHVGDEPATEGFIEIIDVGTGNRVITCIELLSLSNKMPGDGQKLYLQKQRELRAGQVSLVEIDLLRAGHHVMCAPLHLIAEERRTPYMVCIRRGWEPFEVRVLSIPLRQPLPSIPIPLRQTDDDIKLDLQAIVDQCYRNGRYDLINYKVEPDPPLGPDDAKWADELLRSQQLR